MKKAFVKLTVIFALAFIAGCKGRMIHESADLRPLRDTVGFARYAWQMDSIMARIERTGWRKGEPESLRLAICPHDDYTYVGSLYPEICQHITSRTVFILGVAHSAAKLGIEDSLVFDSFSNWQGPSGNVAVSPLREEIFDMLKDNYAIINDTLHILEHSLEAMIPYLQYFNKDLTIVPILVPAMDTLRMEECGKALATAIRTVTGKRRWEWGSDYSIVVTTDAVHYGNEDWGGKDMAYYGCDDAGNMKAVEHETDIMQSCFEGSINREKIRKFSSYTLNKDNYREYIWTWCGRYSVPVALYTALYLDNSNSLAGESKGYASSLSSNHISVDDIGMGRTAPATKCHWVGYAAVAFR